MPITHPAASFANVPAGTRQQSGGVRLLLLSAVTLATLAAVAVLLLYRGWWRFNHPSLENFPVQGIDVSHHQGEIDWSRVAGPGVRFAWIKASEGESHRDRRFAQNWNAARAAGIVPGAYHYYSLCKSPQAQAANFIAAMAQVHGAGLPPAVDAEFGGNCAARPDAQAFDASLDDFLDLVERASGCKAVLYLTPDFHRAHPVAARGRTLWVRSLFSTPTLRRWPSWRWWQYTNRAQVPGIAGYADLDAYRGPARQFRDELCSYGARIT